MRKLFRRDPWPQRLGNRARGIADLAFMAIALALLGVLLGLNSVEVDEFMKWLKTFHEYLTVL